MLNILLISDQPRLHAILAPAGTFPEGSFRIATSLAQGLQQIGEKSPDLLFLQNRLSGLAGLLLVRHVRSSSAPQPAKIILLADGSEESEDSTADIVLHTNVSDAELSDAVTEIIGEILPEGSLHAVDANSVALPALPSPETVDTISLTPPAAPELSARNTPLQIPHATAADTVANLPGKELQQQTTILSSSPPPIQWEKRRLVIALSAVGAVAFTGIVLYLAISRPFISPETQKPATKVPTQIIAPKPPEPANKVATKQPAPLPGFIPVDTPDSAYATTNPGWERYLSQTREFKVFRENGDIKALQVIDTTGSGIPSGFFTSVLKEMAKVSDYRLESREKKDSFIIKKGRLSPAIRVIIYKDKTDKVLNAFVIHFQEQTVTPPGAKEKP